MINDTYGQNILVPYTNEQQGTTIVTKLPYIFRAFTKKTISGAEETPSGVFSHRIYINKYKITSGALSRDNTLPSTGSPFFSYVFQKNVIKDGIILHILLDVSKIEKRLVYSHINFRDNVEDNGKVTKIALPNNQNLENLNQQFVASIGITLALESARYLSTEISNSARLSLLMEYPNYVSKTARDTTLPNSVGATYPVYLFQKQVKNWLSGFNIPVYYDYRKLQPYFIPDTQTCDTYLLDRIISYCDMHMPFSDEIYIALPTQVADSLNANGAFNQTKWKPKDCGGYYCGRYVAYTEPTLGPSYISSFFLSTSTAGFLFQITAVQTNLDPNGRPRLTSITVKNLAKNTVTVEFPVNTVFCWVAGASNNISLYSPLCSNSTVYANSPFTFTNTVAISAQTIPANGTFTISVNPTGWISVESQQQNQNNVSFNNHANVSLPLLQELSDDDFYGSLVNCIITTPFTSSEWENLVASTVDTAGYVFTPGKIKTPIDQNFNILVWSKNNAILGCVDTNLNRLNAMNPQNANIMTLQDRDTAFQILINAKGVPYTYNDQITFSSHIVPIVCGGLECVKMPVVLLKTSNVIP